MSAEQVFLRRQHRRPVLGWLVLAFAVIRRNDLPA